MARLEDVVYIPEEKNRQLMTVTFRTEPQHNEAKSALAGRPIYDDRELCEIRYAGNRENVAVFPAHEVWKVIPQPNGRVEPVTYAMRFKDQYHRFKLDGGQSDDGTPLSELPFLSQGKRLELKAVNVHTAEALASLTGQALKSLGPTGTEMKLQAEAFLKSAKDSAAPTAMAKEIAELRAQMAQLREERDSFAAVSQMNATHPALRPHPESEAAEVDLLDNDQLKDFIKQKAGARPRGNPSRETLINMARELSAQPADAA